jgi:hypothetical protein
MPLERHQQPRRRRLGQSGGSGELGEADRLAAMHDLGEQHGCPVYGLRSVRAAHNDPYCARRQAPDVTPARLFHIPEPSSTM